MNSAKNLYLALVLALAQIIRLSGGNFTNISDQKEKKLFFGLESIVETHPEIDKKTGKEITKTGYLWVLAYLDLEHIRIEGDKDKQKITVPKNSLRVMICKKPENFDEDEYKEKDEYYYMVQQGELKEAFEISHDYVSEIKKEATLTDGKLSKIDPTDKPKIDNYCLNRFTLKAIGTHNQWSTFYKPYITKSEEKKLELQDLTVSLKGYEADTSNPSEIKIADKTGLELFFVLKMNETKFKRVFIIEIQMKQRKEDSQLLQALEDKWAAVKAPNDKNADPSLSNQILDEDGNNQHPALYSEASQPGISKSPEKTTLEQKEKGAEGDKNQKSAKNPESSAYKEKDKSWWENPYIYGGLIVISILGLGLGLGLVAYTFHKRETINKKAGQPARIK